MLSYPKPQEKLLGRTTCLHILLKTRNFDENVMLADRNLNPHILVS